MTAPTDLRIEQLNLSNVLHARVLLRSSLRDEELRPRLWSSVLQAQAGVAERARVELFAFFEKPVFVITRILRILMEHIEIKKGLYVFKNRKRLNPEKGAI